MDEPVWHYVQWNKSVVKRQRLHNSTVWSILNSQTLKNKVECNCQRLGREEWWVFSSYSFSFARWKSSQDLLHNNVHTVNTIVHLQMLRWQNCLMHFWPEKIGGWRHCSFRNSKMEIRPLQGLCNSQMSCNRKCSINTINCENVHISRAVNHETCKNKGSPPATAQWAGFCPPCSVDSLQVDPPPAPSRVTAQSSISAWTLVHILHKQVMGPNDPALPLKVTKNESGREDDNANSKEGWGIF